MGKEARAKAAAPERMLPRQDVPTVAVLALLDALLIDMDRTDGNVSGDREIREWRRGVREQIRGGVERLHGSFQGRVTDGLIGHCDRYLCRVQDALDNFFDDLTEEDLTFIETVKARWPQHGEAE